VCCLRRPGHRVDPERGELFALLGTNGAGKTSTLELVEGLDRPSSGTVRVLGSDPHARRSAVRPRVGVMLQEGRQNLAHYHLQRRRHRHTCLAALSLRAPKPVTCLLASESGSLDRISGDQNASCDLKIVTSWTSSTG